MYFSSNEPLPIRMNLLQSFSVTETLDLCKLFVYPLFLILSNSYIYIYLQVLLSLSLSVEISTGKGYTSTKMSPPFFIYKLSFIVLKRLSK